MADEKKKVEQRIVAATGSASATNKTTGVTSKQMEDAMAQVALDCAAEGITDSATILKRKLEKRAEIRGRPHAGEIPKPETKS